MFLQVDAAAQTKLQSYLDDPNALILLNFDDGVSDYSHTQASCTLNVNFNLTVIQKSADHHDFQQTLTTSVGDFLIKSYSQDFLDEQMQLKATAGGVLQLTGAHAGMIASRVPIVDER